MSALSLTLPYSASPMLRCSEERKHASWLQRQREHSKARVMLMHSQRHWLRQTSEGFEPQWLPLQSSLGLLSTRLNSACVDEQSLVLLGLFEDEPYYTLDVGAFEEDELLLHLDEGSFIDLRRASGQIGAGDAATLAYARALHFWHQTHRYCGCCGAHTHNLQGGHVRGCEACEREIFPRTDPAVIMLVEHKPTDGSPARCLLGHHTRFPKGSYSTLAGFVDAAETVEQAVIREVMEEVGVRVGEVKYQGSQPWPFPSSLMLGFRAQALSTDIKVDGTEIAEARWFTAAELKQAGEWADEEAEVRLSRIDSIARHLINQWIEEQE